MANQGDPFVLADGRKILGVTAWEYRHSTDSYNVQLKLRSPNPARRSAIIRFYVRPREGRVKYYARWLNPPNHQGWSSMFRCPNVVGEFIAEFFWQAELNRAEIRRRRLLRENPDLDTSSDIADGVDTPHSPPQTNNH